MLKKILSTLVIYGLMLWFSVSEVRAYRLNISEDSFINIKMFTQLWLKMDDTGSPDKDNFGAQVYLRRVKIMLEGQVTEQIKFFYGMLHSNFGMNGDYTSKPPIVGLTTVDAWISFDLGQPLKIDVGFLMIPFVRNYRQGGGNLHNIDYHTEVQRFPAGAHFLGRDMGIGLRGALLNNYLTYILQVGRGLWAQDGAPRITGRLVFNLLEAETEFFYAGTYLGTKKVASLGLAFDLQPLNGGLDADGKLTTYYAIGGDLFVDYPFGKNGLTAQINLAYYKNSVGPMPNKTCDIKIPDTCRSISGVALLSEFGYRIRKVSIIAGVDWFAPDNAKDITSHYAGFLFGLNYWIKGHLANLKLQYLIAKPSGQTWESLKHEVLLQAHILLN